MPTSSWDLALVELIYYIPTSIPLLYILWKHRRTGISGWLFLFAFIMLQAIGSGMTLSAGENGKPSTGSIIVSNVGLSPLILGICGIIHEWVNISGILSTKQAKKWAQVTVILYHLLVLSAIAIYAIGASDSFQRPPPEGAQALWKAGVVLLLSLWIGLYAIFGLLVRKIGRHTSAALFWSIAISFTLLGIRIIYQCIATFDNSEPSFNPITGSVVFKVVLEFLPGALILLVMVTGGVMSIQQQGTAYDTGESDIPLNHTRRKSRSNP